MPNKNIEFNVSFISFIRRLDDNEIKLFCYLLNEMDWIDREQNTLHIPIRKVLDLFDLPYTNDSVKTLYDFLKRIGSMQIASKEAIFNIIYAIKFENDEMMIVEFSPLMKSNFITLVKTLAIVPLKSIRNFASDQTAYLFWKLCEEYGKHQNMYSFDIKFTTEETKKLFGISENQYRNSNQSNTFLRTSFEKAVINKSIEEINYSKYGMNVSCTKLKDEKTRRVEGYVFKVELSNIDGFFSARETKKIRIQLFGKGDS